MKKKGSITVFLSLILFGIMELFFLLLEMGRIEVMEYRAKEIGQISLDSSFAGYVRPAFDKYGILMYWGEESNLIKEVNQYIVNNLSAGGEVRAEDFFAMESMGVDIKEHVNITQRNGEEFMQQVESIMKYQLGSEVAKKLLEQCKQFQIGDNAKELCEKVEKEGDTIVSAQKELENVYACARKISSLKTNPKTEAQELLKALQEMEGKSGKEAKKTEKKIVKSYDKLQKAWKQHRKACEKLKKALESYREKVSELKNSVNQLEKDIQTYALTDYEIMKSDMQTCVSDLSEEAGDTGKQSEINDIEAKALEYEKKLNACSLFLNNYEKKQFLNEYDEYFAAVEELNLQLQDYDKVLPVVKEKQSDDEWKGFQKLLKKIKKGSLALVVEDTAKISAKTIDQSVLPSKTQNYKKGSRKIDLKKIVFGEYCIEHFGNYVDKKSDTALDYELEYLLGGKNSDLDNLEYVVRVLVPIRAGFNFLHILKSPKKMKESAALAASICGWTGIPGITILAKYVLIEIWAYGEGVIDVRDLLEGKKVPLIKGDGQWTLSLSHLKEIGSSTKSVNAGEKGFSYANYLRFLLAVQQKGVQCFRCMDLIQMNLNRSDATFRMEDCMVSAKVESVFYAKSLFSDFVSFRNDKQEYVFQTENSRAYE